MGFADDLRRLVFETALDGPSSRIAALPAGSFINDLASGTWIACDSFDAPGGTVQIVSFSLVPLLLPAPFHTLVVFVVTAILALARLGTIPWTRWPGPRSIALRMQARVTGVLGAWMDPRGLKGSVASV